VTRTVALVSVGLSTSPAVIVGMTGTGAAFSVYEAVPSARQAGASFTAVTVMALVMTLLRFVRAGRRRDPEPTVRGPCSGCRWCLVF